MGSVDHIESVFGLFMGSLLLPLYAVVHAAGPFGLSKTPPMGWRSWNSMGAAVTQTKMQLVMEKLAEVRGFSNSQHTSLASLGYATAGLDDAWQACGTGVNNSFHDINGTPLPNTTTFPNLKSMVAYGHRLNISVSCGDYLQQHHSL